jgi:polysaccharide export outer membrane protein
MRVSYKNRFLTGWLVCALALFTAAALGACSDGSRASDPAVGLYAEAAFEPSAAAPSPSVETYRLGPGDALQITVYGEDDLTGSYKVGPDGVIAFPLIGNVHAAGQDLQDLENELVRRLADGYLRAPNVSVDLAHLRPFFIMGEVRTPGSYPYMGEMTALNAVAVAGGFTYRADRKHVKLLRPSSGRESYETVPISEKLQPGDVIMVEERLF